MLNNYITINFVPVAGLLFLLIFLLSNKESDRGIRRIFFLLFILELAEMVFYSAELWTATFAKPTFWRVLLSVLGYSIRPLLLLCILRLSMRNRMSYRKLAIYAIPACINIVVVFSAFFSDIAFFYNIENEFVRGPLGYVPHAVTILYLLCIMILSLQKREEGKKLEVVLILVSCLVIILAIFLEAVFSVCSLGREAIVLSTFVYYLYFQTRDYREDIKGYMEQTIRSQKEHLREMNIIGVLAKEYVTVCYVDVERDAVTAYRMDPFIEANYGEVLRSGVNFEQIFRAYVTRDIYEEDRAFFLELANLQDMISYLRTNGSLSRKYRVWRDETFLYCEMRAELVGTETGIEDIVFGFSNNDTRVRQEMVYQSAVKQEMDKVAEARESLARIADLAKQLQEAIEDKLSSL